MVSKRASTPNDRLGDRRLHLDVSAIGPDCGLDTHIILYMTGWATSTTAHSTTLDPAEVEALQCLEEGTQKLEEGDVQAAKVNLESFECRVYLNGPFQGVLPA